MELEKEIEKIQNNLQARDFKTAFEKKNMFKNVVEIVPVWDPKKQYFVYYEGPGPLSDDGIWNFLSNLLKIRS